jgi:CRISPR/Cas system-associated exonuclease Cas4 (RecB family)
MERKNIMVYDLLFDWQRRLVDSIRDRKSYGLFLDMGLGKTPVSIGLTEVNKVEKLLIITINSKATEGEDIPGSWLNWARKSDMNYSLVTKKDKEIEFNNDNQVFLVNYEYLFERGVKDKTVTLRDTIKEFIISCKGKVSGIIIDESHKMKESKANQTKAINMIHSLLERVSSKTYLYLLSGTPFTKGYIDLYTQLKILGVRMTKTEFKDRFCVLGNVRGLLGWQQPITGYKNIDQLFDLIHTVAITINSKDVISLPEQVFNYMTYPMTNCFKLFVAEHLEGTAITKELKSRNLECDLITNTKAKQLNPFFRNIAYPDFRWAAETSAEFWLRSRELSIGFQGNAEEYQFYDMTRFKMLEKFLSENEDNYLLFYSYTPELLEIYNICEKLGYNIDVYCGEIKSIDNYTKFSRLSKEDKLVSKKNILISNWASGSTGMNFQEYNKCIIFDLPVYKDWQQGIKRIHRTGQTQTCIYYVFMQDCFLDKSMMEAIKTQQDYTKDTFESDLEKVNALLK